MLVTAMSSVPEQSPSSLPPNAWSIDDQEAAFLRAFVQANSVRTVLEFGPGKSTQIFLDAGCEVWSLEHNPVWYERIRQQLGQPPGLKQLLLYAFKPELEIPGLEARRFDLAFVDGPPALLYQWRARLNAIEFAAARTDVILLHDANREKERDSMRVMEEKGWRWRTLPTRRGLAVGLGIGRSIRWPEEMDSTH
jgi:predicted O-methyltransferase YrrM